MSKEIMTYPVVTIAPDTSIAAAAEMITKGIGCLPVVDGTTLVGMIYQTISALPHSAGCGVRWERHHLTHARTTPRLVLWDGKAAHHPG